MEARLHERGTLEDEDKQKGPRGVDSPLPAFGKLAPSIARTKLLFPTNVQVASTHHGNGINGSGLLAMTR